VLRFPHVALLRTHWQTVFAPATANKSLAAVRGVLRQAGLSTAWSSVLSSLPTPRQSRGGPVCRLRCGERAPPGPRQGQERTVYAPAGGQAALDTWLAVRGEVPGPILAAIIKGGVIRAGQPMTAQALMMRLRRRGMTDSRKTPSGRRRSSCTCPLSGPVRCPPSERDEGTGCPGGRDPVGILSMDGLLILACLGDLVSGGLGVQGWIENHFDQREGKGDYIHDYPVSLTVM